MSVLVLTAVFCGILIVLSPVFPGLWLWALGTLLILTVLALRCCRQSRTDDLTGLGNLRALTVFERRCRGCRELGVWYFDVDHLKQINDTQGHSAGDRLLVDFSARLSECKIRGSQAFRIGGDEFLLIVPQPTGDSVPPLPDAFKLPASWGHAAGPGHQLRALILLAEQEMYHKRRIASDE